ncbi:MAG TPA: adenylate/guanylate cyclase domain-containing protein [Mycobacteriales bacterium]|jgi:class 3 adenylate cyclase/tetratricopeptide (TPR) repeat protein|nr:adenylate/guanylate cyclase domain-containing protein [Mycobacteriales bacterium]
MGAATNGGAHAQAGAAAERRVCSVLFCDLVGFTPLSESRDPEEVRELLTRYFETARTVIGRYGGVVEKFIGDAVMAVWGAPVASELDAERAVRAALDLVDAVEDLGRQTGIEGLAARAGVVTGEVAVTLGAAGQGMVAGDAVNTAARVQSTAEPGDVLVDEGTWRLARGAVSFDDAGSHALKGKTEPMRLWRADRVMSGVGGSQRVDGLESPLVGRDAEMRLVKELFHACAERQSPRLVSVTGPAGVGKSRLGWEFFKYVDGLAELVRWHRGRCLSYGDGVAFWALAEMVRQRFGIAEDDTSPTIADKLAAGLIEWVDDANARQYVAPRLARLLGVGDEGAGLGRDELFAGWRVFFESMATKEPVVLLLEDVHYADDGLLDFIEHLLDWAREAPILVITLARPELADRRPGWGMGRRNSTALALEPLSEAAMRKMLDGLVPGMPDNAVDAIASQAQGVPLYAVETVRMLVDRDVVQPVDGVYRLVGDIGELLVPDTLQSLLAARLDALQPAARRLIADAAVLGGSFPLEALSAVGGLPVEEVTTLLAELVRREVLAVRADPLSPERGHYTFVQTMFRQVAYDTLSRRERKTRHLTVADHLARTFADGGEEVSEVIATHLLDALDAVPDDNDVDQIRERASIALIRAGERAERTGAPATAAAVFARAAKLHEQVGTADADRIAADLLERAGSMAGSSGDQTEALRLAEHAVLLFERSGDVHGAARARTSMGAALRRDGRLEEARRVLRQVRDELAGEVSQDVVVALDELAMAELYAGNPESQALAHEALARAQEIRMDDRALSRLLITAGMCASWHAQRIEAIALMREAFRRAEAAQDHRNYVAAALNLADKLVETDPHGAIDAARTAVVHGRRVGNAFLVPTAVSNLVQGLLLTGEWDEAERELQASLDADDVHPMFAYSLALLQGLRGETDGLDELVARIIEDARPEDAQFQALLSTTEAIVAFARDEHNEALAAALRTLALTDQLGCSHEAIRWSWSIAAEASLASGDREEATKLLAWIDGYPVGHLADVQLLERGRLHAKLLAAQEDPEAGIAFEAAVAATRAWVSPYHLGLALLDRAEYQLALGERDQAIDAATEAREIGQRLRCRPILDRALAIAPVSKPEQIDQLPAQISGQGAQVTV